MVHGRYVWGIVCISCYKLRRNENRACAACMGSEPGLQFLNQARSDTAACRGCGLAQGRLTVNYRYTHRKFQLKFSALLKDYDLKYAENSKKILLNHATDFNIS